MQKRVRSRELCEGRAGQGGAPADVHYVADCDGGPDGLCGADEAGLGGRRVRDYGADSGFYAGGLVGGGGGGGFGCVWGLRLGFFFFILWIRCRYSSYGLEMIFSFRVYILALPSTVLG